MSVKVKRGSDKTFLIKCRSPKGDPIDLTNITQVTVKIPKKDNTNLNATLDTVPASFAKITYQGTLFSALVAGPAGNSILLQFNGTLTIQAVVNAWNTANPGNQVGFSGMAGTMVLAAGNAKLTGGITAYERVQILSPAVLGKLKVSLKNADTVDLKLANSVAIEVLLDEGDDPEGTQRGFVIADALDIV